MQLSYDSSNMTKFPFYVMTQLPPHEYIVERIQSKDGHVYKTTRKPILHFHFNSHGRIIPSWGTWTYDIPIISHRTR